MLPLTPWSRRSPAVGPGGVEPPSSGYQPSALPLSYRPCSIDAALRLSLRDGAGGTRTPTPRLKRPMCCRYTTTPRHSHSHSVPLWASQARPAGFEPARQRFWKPPAPPVAPVVCARGGESPVRESNPPPRLEKQYPRPLDDGRAFPVTPAQGVGRVALESTSPPFQSGAIPSQLPARKWPRPGA